MTRVTHPLNESIEASLSKDTHDKCDEVIRVLNNSSLLAFTWSSVFALYLGHTLMNFNISYHSVSTINICRISQSKDFTLRGPGERE